MKSNPIINFRAPPRVVAALTWLAEQERKSVERGKQIKAATRSAILCAAAVEYAIKRGFHPRGKDAK